MTMAMIALLDKPSSSSFGMVPFVVRDHDGTLHVRGIRDRARSTLDQAALDELARSKSALLLPESVTLDQDRDDTVAGWLGFGFRHEVARLRAPEPRVPLLHDIEEHGGFWLDTAASVYQALDQWTREAAAEVFSGTGGAELAELMLWVLPERDETRAAVWHTRGPDSEKRRHLEWYTRLERDAGRSVSTEELEQRFRQVAASYRNR
jgi:hypothetical protein